MCTVGLKIVNVWDLGAGKVLVRKLKRSGMEIIALAFRNHDDEILLGYEDLRIECYTWKTQEEISSFQAFSQRDPANCGGLRVMKLSLDGMQVAFGSKAIAVRSTTYDGKIVIIDT